MTLLLLALLGCGATEPGSPAPAPTPTEPEPAVPEPAPDKPTVYAVAVDVPASGKPGEELAVTVRYELPNPCFDTAVELREPESAEVTLAIDHTAQEGMCAQVIHPVEVTRSFAPGAHAEIEVVVRIDGVEHERQTVSLVK